MTSMGRCETSYHCEKLLEPRNYLQSTQIPELIQIAELILLRGFRVEFVTFLPQFPHRVSLISVTSPYVSFA